MTSELIPPDVRRRLPALRLTTRRAVDRQGLGSHHSRSRGAGLEFAQYRAYERGDEPRAIDWKLYARSDRFFVRESERESPLALWLLLDASASMGQVDSGRAGWSRLASARQLAACLGAVALQQGDRFGLITLSDHGIGVLDAGAGARQRDRLALDLLALVAAGGAPQPAQLAPVWERIGGNDLVVVISDFFDDGMVALAGRLAAAGRDVVAIEVLTVDERDFALRGGFRFRDPESGEELLGDGEALRRDFLDRFGAARAARHARFDALGIRHGALFLDEPADLPLRRLFGAAGR